MLQASVSQHARPVAKLKQSDATQALLQSVTDVAKSLTGTSSNNMTPEAVESAVIAAKSAVSSMLPGLDTEHQASQNEVNLVFGEIGACGDHAVHGMIAMSEHDDLHTESKVALDQCNEELVAAQQSQTSACGAWTRHANALSSSEPSCGHTSTPEQFYESFQAWKEWVEAEDAGIESHRSACNDATTTLSDKQEECATATTDYETAFCQHQLSCGLLAECQAHEARVYEALLVDVRVSEEVRQETYQTVKQIDCLLELITAAIQSNETISPDELSACHGDSDLAHLTLSVPDPSAAVVCVPRGESDPVCPGLAQVSGVSEWSRGEAIRRQVLVTMSGHWRTTLSRPLACDGSETVAMQTVASATTNDCAGRNQCLVEVSADCSVRTQAVDRGCALGGRNRFDWTEFIDSGSVSSNDGLCTLTLGEVTEVASYHCEDWSVEYQGFCYAVLDMAAPDGRTPRSSGEGCNHDLLQMPAGYSPVVFSEDVQANVAAQHTFNTLRVVYANGETYGTGVGGTCGRCDCDTCNSPNQLTAGENEHYRVTDCGAGYAKVFIAKALWR